MAAFERAQKDNRKMVKYEDVAAARAADENLEFLDGKYSLWLVCVLLASISFFAFCCRNHPPSPLCLKAAIS
jgi:hypothetical protein